MRHVRCFVSVSMFRWRDAHGNLSLPALINIPVMSYLVLLDYVADVATNRSRKKAAC